MNFDNAAELLMKHLRKRLRVAVKKVVVLVSSCCANGGTALDVVNAYGALPKLRAVLVRLRR